MVFRFLLVSPTYTHTVHKKKLLDSQMALAKEEGYMELDIKLAARWWIAPGGRNFGLSLEVEDTDGQRKPVNRFFRPRNCSNDGKPPPIGCDYISI